MNHTEEVLRELDRARIDAIREHAIGVQVLLVYGNTCASYRVWNDDAFARAQALLEAPVEGEG